MDLSSYLPVKIVFERGAVKNISKYLLGFSAKNVLLVSGVYSLERSGLIKTFTKELSDANIGLFIYSGVTSDPDTTQVDRGIAFAKKNSCGLVLGIGGGSVIDCAKAIAGLFNEPEFKTSADYLEVDGTKTISTKGIPFVSVPTLSGTGAEVTRNAVIVNPFKKTKRSIRHDFMYPALCIIDPELALNASFESSRSSAIDALCHLLEGYTTIKSTPASDAFALEGISAVVGALALLKSKPADYEVRERIAYASVLGGIVISTAGLTLAHGIGSILGPRFGASHGVSCAVCLPETLALNFPSLSADKQKKLTALFGPDIRTALINILKELGLPEELSKLGVCQADISRLAEDSLNTSSSKGNTKTVDAKEVECLLKRCL